MINKKKTRNIACTVNDFEYNEILMKRYPLKPAEIEKYLSEYGNDTKKPKAVQPLQDLGRKNTTRKSK